MDNQTNTYTTYVFFNRYYIQTTVTNNPSAAAAWIIETETMFQNYNHRQQLVVGLDTEWRPSYQRGIENPIAILQLCVGNQRCLIFQIIHSPYIPTVLINFLNNPSYTFVGVGIHGDFEKLARHYGIITGGGAPNNVVELGRLAAQVYGDDGLRTTALKRLAIGVLGVEVDKPEHVRRGRWDNVCLTEEQVEYACMDGFLCYEIARVLISMGGVV